MDHPSEETLKRFVTGTASREESRAIVAHLVKGCADCARKLKSLIEPDFVSYDDVLDRFDQKLVATLEPRSASAKIARTTVQAVLA